MIEVKIVKRVTEDSCYQVLDPIFKKYNDGEISDFKIEELNSWVEEDGQVSYELHVTIWVNE